MAQKRGSSADVFEVVISNDASEGVRSFESENTFAFETPNGYLHVTVEGELPQPMKKTPQQPLVLTFHDIGLNHSLCFGSLSRLMKEDKALSGLTIVHVDAPGHQFNAEDLGPNPNIDIDDLIEYLEFVCTELSLTNVVGVGVGAGAYILSAFATQHPERISGLFLVGGAVRAYSWDSWISNQTDKLSSIWRTWDISNFGDDFFLHRWFSRNACSQNLPIVETFRRSIQRLNRKNVVSFVQAFLKRTDITESLKNLRCRTVLLAGAFTKELDETIHFQSNVKRELCEWSELEDCGVLITEDKPLVVLKSLKLFFSGFGIN